MKAKASDLLGAQCAGTNILLPIRSLAQPRMPRVPEGVLTLISPPFWPPEENRNAPRVASMAMVPVPLFVS